MNKDVLVTLATEVTKDSLNTITVVLLFMAWTFKDNFHHCMYCIVGAFVVALVRVIIKTIISVKYQTETKKVDKPKK